MELKNKKLLFLGNAVASISMIRYAQKLGAYVIAVDNLPITPLSSKYYADEVANISTYDIDELVKFAKAKEIDGIFCGVSENNLLNVKKICDRLFLPCYFTEDQWQLCENKKSFKDLCIKYNVPVPKMYDIGQIRMDEIQYPVIVKPVDGFAAKGVTICHNKEDVFDAYAYAKRESKTKKAIIEDYIIGDEVTAVYTIKNGDVSLSLFRDRYPSLDHDNVTAQFDACLAPSIYYQTFIKTTNSKLIDLLKGIGAKVGCVFFQGIATKDKVYIFECGYRMNALCDFYNISKGTGLNYMHMLVDYALGEDIDKYDLSLDKPYPKEYYCIFNITAHAGIIGKTIGLEECLNLPNVIFAEFLLEPGHEIEENNSMAQSVFRAYINAESSDVLKDTIRKIQEYIKVYDISGNNMLFKKFDVSRLRFNTLKQIGEE